MPVRSHGVPTTAELLQSVYNRIQAIESELSRAKEMLDMISARETLRASTETGSTERP